MIYLEEDVRTKDFDKFANLIGSKNTRELPIIEARNMEISNENKLVMKNGGIKEFDLTNEGFTDLCSISAMPAQAAHRHMDRGLSVWRDAANSFLRQNNEQVKPIIRENRLVALRSPSYVLVPNEEVLDNMMKNMPDNYRFFTGIWTPARMRAIFTSNDHVVDIDGAKHFSGINLENGEGGRSSLWLKRNLFTDLCTNLTFFGERVMGAVFGIHRGRLADVYRQMMSQFYANNKSFNDKMKDVLPIMASTRFPEDGRFAQYHKNNLEQVIGKRRTKEYQEEHRDNPDNRYYKEWWQTTSFAQRIKNQDLRCDLEQASSAILNYVDKHKTSIKNSILN